MNVKSSLYLFKAALPTFNANPEGGAFIITASIAVRDMTNNPFDEKSAKIQSVVQGVAATGSSLPYAVSKAART